MTTIPMLEKELEQAYKDLNYYKNRNERLNNQLQQKENIIKEVREDLDRQIKFCTNEANGTTNDKICRITTNYLQHLESKLQSLKIKL